MWDEQEQSTLLKELYYLTAKEKSNWRKLLALGNTLEQQFKRKLLWIWPTAENLFSCNQILTLFNIQSVLSIGCGSGLLEWLLTAASDNALSINGLEVDRNWWQSKYAMRSFIELHYVEDAPGSQLDANFLSSCCGADLTPHALLFCYFNNRKAFMEYLDIYKGKWLILIGPKPTVGIHTDPNPLQPHLPATEWMLREMLHWTEENIVAFYERLV